MVETEQVKPFIREIPFNGRERKTERKEGRKKERKKGRKKERKKGSERPKM